MARSWDFAAVLHRNCQRSHPAAELPSPACYSSVPNRRKVNESRELEEARALGEGIKNLVNRLLSFQVVCSALLDRNLPTQHVSLVVLNVRVHHALKGVMPNSLAASRAGIRIIGKVS